MALLELPDVRRNDGFSCGAAAVAVALRYFGRRRGQDELAERLLVTQVDGTDVRAMEAVLRRCGLRVISGEMTLDDLSHHARLGRPVITPITVADDGREVGHYVVTAGRRRGRVHFQDPTDGPLRMSDARFLGCWRDYDRLGGLYLQFGLAVWEG